LRIWIDSFIQVARHVPRFKNLIKTSYYYFVPRVSSLFTQPNKDTPPGVFLTEKLRTHSWAVIREKALGTKAHGCEDMFIHINNKNTTHIDKNITKPT